MAATLITLSPLWTLDDAARRVRSGVGRDGRAAVYATTSDRRQVRQLRRLSHLLEAGGDLDCDLGTRTNGETCLNVYHRANKARRGIGLWGDPRGVSDPGGPYIPYPGGPYSP
ncbi:MAG TPA: hypothetical protein VF086_09605 [Propionibacteriaceae bacterium]